MEEGKRTELRAIYSQLRGYLAGAPEADEYSISEESIWIQYNAAVNSLKEITGKGYNQFSMQPKQDEHSTRPSIINMTYRSSLNGLISRLHGEYFHDEPNPLDGTPSTVITQNQQQGQSVYIQMIVEITDIINEKIDKYKEGSKEKGFFQKLKSSLSSTANAKQLLQSIFKLAKDSGLNVDDVLKVFT